MKRLVIHSLIIVILFLVGCASQIINPEVKSQSGNEVLNECFSKIDETPGESYIQYQKDLCRLSVAKESKNKGLCSGIDNENKKEECNKYFDELPFVEGTATKEDILEKCKCDYYCYGRIYEIDCIYKNVKTPQQCLSFIGLHYDNYISSPDKIYFEEGELKKCLRSLISRTNDSSFCKESPELYFNFCEELKQEKISEEKARIASLTRHVMTEDKDEWIFPYNSLDEAHGIIEEWKEEGYKNFRIIECIWDEEFEVCIDYNTIWSDGDTSKLILNRHLKNMSVDFYNKHYELLDINVCDNPPAGYAAVCERVLEKEAERQKEILSSSTMHILTDGKEIWIGDNINEGKRIVEEWKKEEYKNFRIIMCDWDEEFEVCIDYNTVWSDGDYSQLECNGHLRKMNLWADIVKKYPQWKDRKFC